MLYLEKYYFSKFRTYSELLCSSDKLLSIPLPILNIASTSLTDKNLKLIKMGSLPDELQGVLFSTVAIWRQLAPIGFMFCSFFLRSWVDGRRTK